MSYVFADGTPVPQELDVVSQADSGKPLVFSDGRWHEVRAARPSLVPSPSDKEKPNANSFLPPIGIDGGRNEFRGIEVVNASELAAADVTEVETLPLLARSGYIGVKNSTLISSYPKTGKTTLLKAMALEWGQAGLKVLIFTEENRQTWEIRLQEEPELWAHVTIAFALGAGRDAILELIETSTDDVIVVDTLRNCLGFKDEKDNSEVARVVTPLINAARHRNMSLIGFTHETKAGGEHGRGIAGGHGLLAAFDGALEIQRVPEAENRRKVTCYARLLNPPELLFEQRDDGSLFALGEVHLVQKEEVRRRVWEVLTDEGQPLNEIREALGDPSPSTTNVREALAHHVASGFAERLGEGKKGDPYLWRALAAPDEAPDPISIRPPSISIGGRNESPPTSRDARLRNEDEAASVPKDKSAGEGGDSAPDELGVSIRTPSPKGNDGGRNESPAVPLTKPVGADLALVWSAERPAVILGLVSSAYPFSQKRHKCSHANCMNVTYDVDSNGSALCPKHAAAS